MTGEGEHEREEIPRFTLAAFFTAPEPCEDALLNLGNAYNRLADRVEEAWAEIRELEEQLDAMRQTLDFFVNQSEIVEPHDYTAARARWFPEDPNSVEAGIRGWIEDKQMRRNP